MNICATNAVVIPCYSRHN